MATGPPPRIGTCLQHTRPRLVSLLPRFLLWFFLFALWPWLSLLSIHCPRVTWPWQTRSPLVRKTLIGWVYSNPPSLRSFLAGAGALPGFRISFEPCLPFLWVSLPHWSRLPSQSSYHCYASYTLPSLQLCSSCAHWVPLAQPNARRSFSSSAPRLRSFLVGIPTSRGQTLLLGLLPPVWPGGCVWR